MQNRLSKCDYSLVTKTDFRAQQPEGSRQVPLFIVTSAWDHVLQCKTQRSPKIFVQMWPYKLLFKTKKTKQKNFLKVNQWNAFSSAVPLKYLNYMAYGPLCMPP